MDRSNTISQPIYHWDYDQGILTRYIRVGECVKCGNCCRGFLKIYVAACYDPQVPQQGGKATTGRGTWIEINHNEQRVFFRLGGFQNCDRKCASLIEDNTCGKYTRRPLFCQVFPVSPENIATFPDCTYSFQKAGEWTFDYRGIQKSVKEGKQAGRNKQVKEYLYERARDTTIR